MCRVRLSLCCLCPSNPAPPHPHGILCPLPPAPAVLPPPWAADPASVHRAAHQGEGEDQPTLHSRTILLWAAELRVRWPAFLGGESYCQLVQPPPLWFLPVLASPSLLLLPCPSSPSEGSPHHLLAPSREIAAIHQEQQSPSNPIGKAINFRDIVASGFRDRNGGCVQGTWGDCLLIPRLCANAPAPAPP